MLRLADVATPVPTGDEVLVRVCAVSLNRSDREVLRGRPLYSRIGGPFRPKFQTLGSAVAGRVEAVGPAASRFRPGEDVFGDLLDHIGGFAEYVCVPERALAPMPEGMAYEEAACLPPAGAIAWQFATGSSHDQTFTWTLTVAISPGRVRRADVDIGS